MDPFDSEPEGDSTREYHQNWFVVINHFLVGFYRFL